MNFYFFCIFCVFIYLVIKDMFKTQFVHCDGLEDVYLLIVTEVWMYIMQGTDDPWNIYVH